MEIGKLPRVGCVTLDLRRTQRRELRDGIGVRLLDKDQIGDACLLTGDFDRMARDGNAIIDYFGTGRGKIDLRRRASDPSGNRDTAPD